MKTKKLICTLLVGAMIASVSLSGCGKEQPNTNTGNSSAVDKEVEDVTLRLGYWGNAEDVKAYEIGIKGIEEVEPGLSIELQQYPTTDDFWNNLPAQIAAKTAPDIISVTNELYLEFIENDLYLPLNPDVIDLTDVSKSAIDVWTVNDKLYGFPVSAGPGGLAINLDMWEAAGLGELPKTWDDVEVAAKALTTEDTYGLGINEIDFHLTQYALSFGGGWGEGKTINSEENIAAIDFVLEMIRGGYAVTPKQEAAGWDGELFTSGKVAMTTAGVWYVSNMKLAAPDINWALIPVPQVDPSNPSCALHSVAFTGLSSTEYPELVEKAISHLGRAEYQQASMDLTGIIPSNEVVASKAFENPQVAQLKPAMSYAQPFGFPIESQKFSTYLMNGVGEAIYVKDSTLTGKDILDDLQSKFPN